MRPEPQPLAQRGSATLLAGGSAGTLSSVLSAILPEPWKSWLLHASPWVAAMVAALWPNAWERLLWRRLRRQGLDTLDTLILELKQFHAQVVSAAVRKEIMRRIHQLEARRLRITAAIPFMAVSIHAESADSLFLPRETSTRSYPSPPPPGR
jgi:hypothetical protein